MTQRCYKLIGRICGEGGAATSRVFNLVAKRAEFVQRQKASNGLTIASQRDCDQRCWVGKKLSPVFIIPPWFYHIEHP